MALSLGNLNIETPFFLLLPPVDEVHVATLQLPGILSCHLILKHLSTSNSYNSGQSLSNHSLDMIVKAEKAVLILILILKSR